MTRKSLIVTVVAVAIALTASVASAGVVVPVVDGRFDSNEGYTSGHRVDFAVERSDAIVSGGELWTHQDAGTGDVYVFFSQPLTLVDNTYGDNIIGWGPAAPSGKRHNFKDLKESDKVQFVFTDGLGNVVLDVEMDYISETSEGSGIFRCLGVTGSDGRVLQGSADSMLEWGSSLDYNFNTLGFVLTEDSPATDDNYSENPDYPGWVFEVAYELRISGALFDAAGFGDVNIPIAHDSPNKIGKNKTYPDINGEIPEPATLTLFGLGGLGMLLRRRK